MTGSRNLVRLVELLFVVIVELLLYLRFQEGDGTFQYFTHFFAGASFALVLMTLAARRLRRPVRLPLLAVLAGHLFATAPDILYLESVAHTRWMDVFVAHYNSHFLPGRNISWCVEFLAAMTLYLVTARADQTKTICPDRAPVRRRPARPDAEEASGRHTAPPERPPRHARSR